MLRSILRKVKMSFNTRNILLVLSIVFALIVALDYELFFRALREAKWYNTIFAIVFGLLSFFFWGLAYVAFCHIYEIRIRKLILFSIGFVANAAERLISTNGTVSTSLRVMMSKKYGVKIGDMLAVSAMHTYVTSIVPFLLLPASVIHLMLKSNMTIGKEVMIYVFVSLIMAIFLFATFVMFIDTYRLKFLSFVTRVTHRLFKKDIHNHTADFDSSLSRAVEVLKKKPSKFTKPFGYIILDWLGAFLSMAFCLRAFGVDLSIVAMLGGFMTAISLGSISMVPGGLGVQEGVFVLTYTSLGAPFEAVFLASVLFRIVYSIIPFGLSFFFARLVEVDKSVGSAIIPNHDD